MSTPEFAADRLSFTVHFDDQRLDCGGLVVGIAVQLDDGAVEVVAVDQLRGSQVTHLIHRKTEDNYRGVEMFLQIIRGICQAS